MDAIKKGKKSKKEYESLDEEEEEQRKSGNKGVSSSKKKKAQEHMKQLQRLQEKDPEFYEFLKEHDKELLEFNDEDIDEDAETDIDGEGIEEDEETDGHDMHGVSNVLETEEKSSKNVITSAMVDSWSKSIRESTSIGAVRSLMRAFRTACHYGDDAGDESTNKFNTMSSSVFNKIMLFVLSEMDGILRGLLKLPPSGGNKKIILDLMNTRPWKNYNNLVKSYLGNALHVLNQMTDTNMVSFTLRRLRYSCMLLAAFPALLRKYVKVVLHFWGTGGGALPVASFLFLRDLCMQLGSDCFDDCIKGMYKAYVLNSQYVTTSKLQHIQFLGNCFIELLSVDLASAYQHAFLYIRQLATILRETISSKKMELLRKVYGWKFINCLELWTGAICAYNSESGLKHLAYPLTQIITGAARLVPTAQYFPLRLRCIRMLNRIAISTGTFIPVSLLLLDMLEIKELSRPPTGGVGEAVDFHSVLRVSKSALKTKAFQEACVFSVLEELTEHLAQWSYSVAFYELSFIPAGRLRKFCKSTKVDRFRREMRQLIRQIEANCEFMNKKRTTVSFLPNDPEAASFLEDERKSGSSPLSQYVAILRQRAQQRYGLIKGSGLVVGEHASTFVNGTIDKDEDEDDLAGNEEGVAAFNSSWLPGSNPKPSPSGEKKKKRKEREEKVAQDEDIVEDYILSSDEEDDSIIDGPESDAQDTETNEPESETRKPHSKNRKKSSKFTSERSMKKSNVTGKKSKKRKRRN
ncbi:hypothetical protein M9H77_11283 [Catharanthus roseus]|uniref:Uncharacterized protein n=1 Tax=Catharanthus roseus TaxID=4058 RepID=A0ACC0BE42_CATRO|nr:hypothetical protein M9H77_11283 [Catharanthus roseus]